MFIELGFSSFGCYKDKLIDKLSEFASSEVKNIEIWSSSAHSNPDHFRYRDKNYLDRFSHELKKFSLHPYSIHAPIDSGQSIFSPDELEREKALKEAEKVIDALARIGGELLVVHPGVREIANRKIQLEVSLASLRQILNFCQKHNIRLALENMCPGEIGSRVEDLEYLLAGLSSAVGICLDTGHAYLNDNLFELIENLRERIIHLHIQDTHKGSDEHLIPFQGKINWRKFMHKLKEIGYQGIFMMELRERESGLEDLLKEAKNAFAKLLYSVKQF